MTRPQDISILRDLERKALWLSSWMIHNANHLRENVDGLKVGGHQASSASLTTMKRRCEERLPYSSVRMRILSHALFRVLS